MITVDKPTLEQSLARWNGFITAKAQALHLVPAGVVKKESGRLVQTLIRISPPADRTASAKKLGDKVQGTFHVLGQENSHDWSEYSGTKAGGGDVRWYAFQSDSIYGIAKDKDMTDSTVDDLYQTFYKSKLNKDGRIIAGKRGKQTVYLWAKITTKAATVKKLAARLKKHFGRLKAGWLPAWKALGRPSGEYSPPSWVTQHESGARGYAIDGLANKEFPQFTLENHAKGAGADKMRQLVRDALEIRSKAIAKRMAFLLKYPEKVSEDIAA